MLFLRLKKEKKVTVLTLVKFSNKQHIMTIFVLAIYHLTIAQPLQKPARYLAALNMLDIIVIEVLVVFFLVANLSGESLLITVMSFTFLCNV